MPIFSKRDHTSGDTHQCSGAFATRVPELRPSVIVLLKRSLIDEDDEVVYDGVGAFFLLKHSLFSLPLSTSVYLSVSYCLSFLLSPLEAFFLSSPSSVFLSLFLIFVLLSQVRDRAAILLRAFATLTDEADLKCLFDEPMPMYVTTVQ